MPLMFKCAIFQLFSAIRFEFDPSLLNSQNGHLHVYSLNNKLVNLRSNIYNAPFEFTQSSACLASIFIYNYRSSRVEDNMSLVVFIIKYNSIIIIINIKLSRITLYNLSVHIINSNCTFNSTYEI